MKKVVLDSIQGSNTKLFFKLFNRLLEVSDYNLNQYVEGSALNVGKTILEKYKDQLEELLSIAPEVFSNHDEGYVQKIVEQLEDYEQVKDFLEWIEGYVTYTIQRYKDMAFIRELDKNDFEKIVQYCFDNLLMKDIGRDNIQLEGFQDENIIMCSKFVFTVVNMTVCENYAKMRVITTTEKIFGIKPDYCELLWNLIEENEEKLWRIMMMRNYSQLKEQVESILDEI